MLFIQLITNIVGGLFKISYDSSFLAITDTFSKSKYCCFVLIAITLLLYLLRSKKWKKRSKLGPLGVWFFKCFRKAAIYW